MNYTLFNLSTKKSIYFKDLEALIWWFSQYNTTDPWLWSSKKINNQLKHNINMNFNDTKVVYNWESGKTVFLREIIVFDSYYRIIDPRIYEKEILNTKFSYSTIEDKAPKGYVFRKTPIPYTKKRKTSGYYRYPRNTQELRENKDYIRAKRFENNKVYWMDDIPRHLDKCWKSNTKARRQWMKNL